MKIDRVMPDQGRTGTPARLLLPPTCAANWMTTEKALKIEPFVLALHIRMSRTMHTISRLYDLNHPWTAIISAA